MERGPLGAQPQLWKALTQNARGQSSQVKDVCGTAGSPSESKDALIYCSVS